MSRMKYNLLLQKDSATSKILCRFGLFEITLRFSQHQLDLDNHFITWCRMSCGVASWQLLRSIKNEDWNKRQSVFLTEPKQSTIAAIDRIALRVAGS